MTTITVAVARKEALDSCTRLQDLPTGSHFFVDGTLYMTVQVLGYNGAVLYNTVQLNGAKTGTLRLMDRHTIVELPETTLPEKGNLRQPLYTLKKGSWFSCGGDVYQLGDYSVRPITSQSAYGIEPDTMVYPLQRVHLELTHYKNVE